jgi:hypothetical protein
MTDLMLQELRRIAGQGLIPALQKEARSLLGADPCVNRLEDHGRASAVKPTGLFRFFFGFGRFSLWKPHARNMKLWMG